MELFKTEATIEKLISKTKGTEYIVIKLPLSSDYTYTIFPKDAELAIIKRSDFLNKNTSTDQVSFKDFE